jgi:hypothetical protein
MLQSKAKSLSVYSNLADVSSFPKPTVLSLSIIDALGKLAIRKQFD